MTSPAISNDMYVILGSEAGTPARSSPIIC